MKINWKPINTAPLDRPVYLWDKERGAQKMKFFTPAHNELWEKMWKPVPVDSNKRTVISTCSLRPPEWQYWCEPDELEPQL